MDAAIVVLGVAFSFLSLGAFTLIAIFFSAIK